MLKGTLNVKKSKVVPLPPWKAHEETYSSDACKLDDMIRTASKVCPFKVGSSVIFKAEDAADPRNGLPLEVIHIASDISDFSKEDPINFPPKIITVKRADNGASFTCASVDLKESMYAC